MILNDGLEFDDARAALRDGRTDAVFVGTPFISNPNPVTRFAHRIALAMPDQATFYTPEPEGHSGYPLAEIAAA